MIKFHFYDMEFGEKADIAADLAAHRERLKEAKKAARWAEHTGDHRRAAQWYQQIIYRREEIRRLEGLAAKQTA